MAGSYNHCVDGEGRLLDPERLSGMLENGCDVYEAVEELYGMVWYLADALEAAHEDWGSDGEASDLVAEARQRYRQGLQKSPGKAP